MKQFRNELRVDKSALSQYFCNALQVLFGIDPHGVVWSQSNKNIDAIFQKPQLLETLALFQG